PTGSFYLITAQTCNIRNTSNTEWFPSLILDVQQMGSSGARKFVPPYKPPVNPNIDPLIHQATDLVGAHIALDLARHGKKGVTHSTLFDLWWAGSTLSEPRNHNMIAVLSETASCKLATPFFVDREGKKKGGKGGAGKGGAGKGGAGKGGDASQIPVSPNTLDPWLGGWWRLRDAVDY